MVSLDDVLAAREAAAGRLHRTPLFRSQILGAIAGADVHLKAELEVVEDLPETATLIVPVGGGGLISGIAVAAQGRRVIGVEPELSPAMHEALAAGEPVPVEPRSIADWLS